jgi:hypothetical protein
MIDANAKTLGSAVERNFARWPVAQGPYADRAEFAQDIAEMKLWTEARVAWLDQQIKEKYSGH